MHGASAPCMKIKKETCKFQLGALCAWQIAQQSAKLKFAV